MTDVYVIDLFCGCGGFSTGARQAGAHVILAIDCWNEALDVHKANHPDTEHLCMTLGGDVYDFATFLVGFINLNVPTGGHVHLHASPPCGNLSSINKLRDEDIGMKLVHWTLSCIKTVENAITTWSMEEVSHIRLTPLILRYGGKVFKMNEFGVPQVRRRTFLGNVDWERVIPQPGLTMSQVMQSLHYTPPEGMDFISSKKIQRTKDGVAIKRGDGKNLTSHREFHHVCLTVCCTSPIFYNSESGTSMMFPIPLMLTLQTFPQDYNFIGTNKGTCRKLIANAIPPSFASLVIAAASNGPLAT